MNKRAQWIGEALYYFFYVILTIIVVSALIVIPNAILNKAAKPYPLDLYISEQRLVHKFSQQNPYLPYALQPPTTEDIFVPSGKAHGYRVTIGETEYPALTSQNYYRKQFDFAYQLTNKYEHTKSTYDYTKEGERVPVVIEQTLNRNYE